MVGGAAFLLVRTDPARDQSSADGIEIQGQIHVTECFDSMLDITFLILDASCSTRKFAARSRIAIPGSGLPGSARVSRAGFGVSPKQIFSQNGNRRNDFTELGKFAIAGTPSPHATRVRYPAVCASPRESGIQDPESSENS